MLTNPNTTAYQQNIVLTWKGDLSTRDHILPGGARIDAALFNGADAVVVTVAPAGAAADAVSVPIAALLAELPPVQLFFGGKKFANVTTNAAKGAVQLVTSALPTALVSGDKAYFNPPNVTKRILAGTAIGLTNGELEGSAATGVLWGPAADGDDVVRLICNDVLDADKNSDIEIYRPGSLVYVNNLPGWAGLSTAVKNKIRATYECSVAAPGAEVAGP